MSEQRIEKNKVVTFTCVIQDDQGEILEQSDLAQLEVTLPPEEGFGERAPLLTWSDEIENVPPEFQQIGAEAMFRNDAGETVTMRVTGIDNGIIMLDSNSPFAGKTVIFRITTTGIRDATEQEVGAGQPADQMQMLSLH